MDDKQSGGNGDGRISPGEQVRICASLRNFGEEPCPEGFVSVDTRMGPISGWRKTYQRFKQLDPGQARSICFMGKARRDFKEEEGKVTVRYGEWQGRILGARSVKVKYTGGSNVGTSEKLKKKPAWSPALVVEAGKLAVEGESVCLSIGAWSNGKSLRDMFIYVEDKKVLYQKLGDPHVQLRECIQISPGSSQIDVVVRNDNRSYARERLFVYRLK
jgi:hypothetical protein